jgi:hypothetical protein
MVGLRTRAVRFWLATIGLLSIAVLYVAPTVEAIIAARPARTMPAMAVPVPWFPTLAPPKLHAAPAVPHIKPIKQATSTPQTAQKTRKRVRTTVPVAHETYSFAPATSSTTTSTPATYASAPAIGALATAISKAPVTTDISGTPEPISANARADLGERRDDDDRRCRRHRSGGARAGVDDAADAGHRRDAGDDRCVRRADRPGR